MNTWKVYIEIVCEGNPEPWIYQSIQEQLNKNEQIVCIAYEVSTPTITEESNASN